MITFTTRGSTKNLEKFLAAMQRGDLYSRVDGLAKRGVEALRAATPVDSGITASNWGYEITKSGRSYTITWTNTHVINGFPVAIGLQYGHSTGTGGWVAGRDYINPAMRPTFDAIADAVWKAVQSA